MSMRISVTRYPELSPPKLLYQSKKPFTFGLGLSMCTFFGTMWRKWSVAPFSGGTWERVATAH